MSKVHANSLTSFILDIKKSLSSQTHEFKTNFVFHRRKKKRRVAFLLSQDHDFMQPMSSQFIQKCVSYLVTSHKLHRREAKYKASH